MVISCLAASDRPGRLAIPILRPVGAVGLPLGSYPRIFRQPLVPLFDIDFQYLLAPATPDSVCPTAGPSIRAGQGTLAPAPPRLGKSLTQPVERESLNRLSSLRPRSLVCLSCFRRYWPSATPDTEASVAPWCAWTHVAVRAATARRAPCATPPQPLVVAGQSSAEGPAPVIRMPSPP